MNQASETIKNKKIKYFECEEGDLHQGELLNYITVDPTLFSNGIICGICKQMKYQKNKVMPLKIFLSEVDQKSKSSPVSVEGQEELLRKSEEIQEKMLRELRSTVQKMAEQIKELEESIKQNYDKFKQKVVSQECNPISIVETILNTDYSDVKVYKQDISKLIKGMNLQTLEFEKNSINELKKSLDYLKDLGELEKTFIGSITRIRGEANEGAKAFAK